MLSWLAGRRSPSVTHLLTDDPLAVISAPADKHQTVYAVSRVNPVFKDEGWRGAGRAAADDDRSGWQLSAADGRSYWHEPAPDSLEPAAGGPPSPVAARRFVEYRGAPLPVFPGGAGRARLPDLQWERRPSTLPRPVWPRESVEQARPRSTDGDLTNVPQQIGATWPTNRQHAAAAHPEIDGRATVGCGRAVFTDMLPPTITEEGAAAERRTADGQPDSIVTDSLLLLTSPRPTPTGSLRAGSTEKAESFSWEEAAVCGPQLPPPPPPPPGPAAVSGFSWERTLEPLLQVLWASEQSSVPEDPEVGAGQPDDQQLWRASLPAPPSGAGSERSQLYSVPVGPRLGGVLEEELYAWPVTPPVAVPATLLSRPPPPARCESPPAYLNQLLPSDASDGGRSRRLGSDASQSSRRLRRLPSDAQSDGSLDSRGSGGSGGSRGSRGRLLPSDGSEGGSERRVTFSADTVDNEPGPGRPRPRRPLERGPGPGATRVGGKPRRKGFYTANVLSRLTGASKKTGQKQELEFRNFAVDVGRVAALRRQGAGRWRSRYLCSAFTVLLVFLLLFAAGGLIGWLWTTEERLFRV